MTSSASEFVELDWEFHHTIARAGGNDLLLALLDGLTEPTMRMRVWRGLSIPGVLERTLDEHEAIVDALESHDADLARAAATVHVAGVEAWVRSQEPGWSALAARAVHGAAWQKPRTPTLLDPTQHQAGERERGGER